MLGASRGCVRQDARGGSEAEEGFLQVPLPKEGSGNAQAVPRSFGHAQGGFNQVIILGPRHTYRGVSKTRGAAGFSIWFPPLNRSTRSTHARVGPKICASVSRISTSQPLKPTCAASCVQVMMGTQFSTSGTATPRLSSRARPETRNPKPETCRNRDEEVTGKGGPSVFG